MTALQQLWNIAYTGPGWLLQSLNLITIPSSVSDEPGSVTWLAISQLKKAMLSVGKMLLKINYMYIVTTEYIFLA